MSTAPLRSRNVWLVLALIGIGIGGLLVWKPWQSEGQVAPEQPEFPIPPVSTSRFLNVGQNAHYVGQENCKDCHRSKHSSYLRTAHSLALDDIDLKSEPPDGTFEHSLSGRAYRIYRQGEQLRHKGAVLAEDGEEIVSLDLPIRYVIGSGRFTRSYIVQVDGFLHESPITWFASRKAWDMSPGYNQVHHLSFERPINIGCLSCHTGRVESRGSPDQALIHEQSIGCESCHGPGSLHVDFHRQKKELVGEEDLTIVNPRNLSRSRLEAICAQCHQQGEATIILRGRDVNDFRPGRPLTDVRVDYHFKADNQQMTVVGHLEQMRLSRCYQKSATMTCITCHDPHARESLEDSVDIYKKKCLGCHQAEHCGLDSTSRLKKSPKDNCVECHMPTADTEIQHIAFTHHRIGIHDPKSAPTPKRVPDLVAMQDTSTIPEIDRKRNLGLAYLRASHKQKKNRQAYVTYRRRALELLEAVQKEGLADGDADEGLARIYWNVEPERALTLASQSLKRKHLSPMSRINALVILSDCQMRFNKFKEAVPLLQDLTKLRRSSDDWMLLGVSYLKLNRFDDAIAALQQSVKINPFRPDTYRILSEAHQQKGELNPANQHRKKADLLAKRLSKQK